MSQRVVVVGLGVSGRAAATLALAQGASVIGVDDRMDIDPVPGVQLERGPIRARTLLSADLVVVSPGVPLSLPALQTAKQAGIPLIGELGFAANALSLPMVAITGTNGKSTVTHFTGTLLATSGYRPFVGGNLGNPLSNLALDPSGYDCAVVEVSSYQLELPGSFHPRVGVVLNLSPDHLARHGTLAHYAWTKCRLFQHMTPGDMAVLPAEHPLLHAAARDQGRPTRLWLGKLPGVRREHHTAHIHIPQCRAQLDLSQSQVLGAHNLDNTSTAALLALGLGASRAGVQRGIARLTPLPHRMEPVAKRGGVDYINDSKATNVEATRVGVSGLARPAVVLLGGQAKGESFAPLAPLLGAHRAVIGFGASGPAIARELDAHGLKVMVVPSLAQAVHTAHLLARPGDVVLLSPGCASFDAFTDFTHRGQVFRQLVQGLTP